jgi:hypothetical protein
MAPRRVHAGAALSAVAALLAASTPAPAWSACVMSQDCAAGGPGDSCHPYAIPPSPPFPLPADNVTGLGWACPQYKDTSCCNGVQNRLLVTNFMLLHAFFGMTAAGGCPACEQNLRNLWCEYTCSPRQDSWVTPLGIENVTNPTSGVLTTVLATDVLISSKYACAIFASCAATAKVKTYAPMDSCEGLLAYQGGTGAIPQGAYLTFTYSGAADGSGTDPAALSADYYNCCSYPSNFSNPAGGNVSCPCASCAGCCAGGACYDGAAPAGASAGGAAGAPNITLAGLGDTGLSALSGFNAGAVGGMYAGLAVLSAVVLFWPRLSAAATRFITGGKSGGSSATATGDDGEEEGGADDGDDDGALTAHAFHSGGR